MELPKCINFGGHKFPSEATAKNATAKNATAKNAWIKWLDEPEKRKLGCRWQFHAVVPRSSLPHAVEVQFRRLFPMSPAFRAICGANLFRCEWVPYLSEYVCNIWLRSDGRVERKRGYRHTDRWHEWEQDNFYGGSATERIVIKEPSLFSVLMFVHGRLYYYVIFRMFWCGEVHDKKILDKSHIFYSFTSLEKWDWNVCLYICITNHEHCYTILHVFVLS